MARSRKKKAACPPPVSTPVNQVRVSCPEIPNAERIVVNTHCDMHSLHCSIDVAADRTGNSDVRAYGLLLRSMDGPYERVDHEDYYQGMTFGHGTDTADRTLPESYKIWRSLADRQFHIWKFIDQHSGDWGWYIGFWNEDSNHRITTVPLIATCVAFNSTSSAGQDPWSAPYFICKGRYYKVNMAGVKHNGKWHEDYCVEKADIPSLPEAVPELVVSDDEPASSSADPRPMWTRWDRLMLKKVISILEERHEKLCNSSGGLNPSEMQDSSLGISADGSEDNFTIRAALVYAGKRGGWNRIIKQVVHKMKSGILQSATFTAMEKAMGWEGLKRSVNALLLPDWMLAKHINAGASSSSVVAAEAPAAEMFRSAREHCTRIRSELINTAVGDDGSSECDAETAVLPSVSRSGIEEAVERRRAQLRASNAVHEVTTQYMWSSARTQLEESEPPVPSIPEPFADASEAENYGCDVEGVPFVSEETIRRQQELLDLFSSASMSETLAEAPPAEKPISPLPPRPPPSPPDPPNDLTCPISMELLTRPVINSIGNVYQESAIRQHYAFRKAQGLPLTDPVTNEVVRGKYLTPCNRMRAMALEWADRNGYEIPDEPSFD